MELITTLGIDWKLLLVQLLNFGILIVVLTVLVYRPVLRLLDDRRERIRKSVEDTKAIENQRRELDEFKNEQMKKIDLESGKFLEAAKHQAESVKKEILANAEKESSAILTKAKQALDEERGRMVREMQGNLASVVVHMAEKIIEREFSKSDQDRLIKDVEKSLPALLK
ncbi:ATP synthase F0 subunit B [Candidatus Peribacteria bacterium]|nr:ATP synthase F0 subunit B [Candidatus Peribacteria bacterium]